MDAVNEFERFVKGFFPPQKVSDFEDKLFLNKSRMKNLKGFLLYSIIEGIVLMNVAIGAIWYFEGWVGEKSIIGAIAAFFAPFFINYIFNDIIFEKRKRQKEELISDLLLEASIFCDEASTQKTLKRVAEQDFPYLKEDFERAYTEIANGASVEEALERLKKLNKSRAYSRAIDLILQGYKSGAKISDLMKETAEDLLETKAIIKERQAVMLVTKYTLLASAGLIVPAILGLIIGLVNSLNFDSLSTLSFGLELAERKALFETAISATTAYIVEYAALSAFFLSLQEGNKKMFWVYLVILVPISTGVYFAARIFGPS